MTIVQPAAKELGERQRERKRARVAVDGANSGENDDCNVDKEIDGCRSETSRWKRDLKKQPTKEEAEGEEEKVDEAGEKPIKWLWLGVSELRSLITNQLALLPTHQLCLTAQDLLSLIRLSTSAMKSGNWKHNFLKVPRINYEVINER